MKWKYTLALIIVAIGAFYLGTTVKNSSQVQASQETQSAVKQFTPTVPTDAPETKSTLGVIGDIGFRVNDVEAGSPAEQIGIQRGDVIIELDGKQFYSIKDFISIMAEKEPGDAVAIGYNRFNKETGQREQKTLTTTVAPLNR